MEKHKQFCDLFHASHYLPIAFYQGETQQYLCSSYTGLSDIFYASAYKLLTQKQNPAVYATAEIGLYGIVRVVGTEDAYVLGPVFGGAVTEETVYAFMQKMPFLSPKRMASPIFCPLCPDTPTISF